MEHARQIVRLCGVQGCCPEVERTEDGAVLIRDDFGGTVKLTAAQWSDLKKVQLTE